VAVNPLTPSEASFWDLRRRGKGFAEIGRVTGVTRQAVYKAMLKADKAMADAFTDVAGTYRIDLEKVSTGMGMARGYSHTLRSMVVLAYDPDRGITVWYDYAGNCNGCAKRSECMSRILSEAARLGVTPPEGAEKMAPAEVAEEVLRKAWPEGFD
jgi:hypothetical protein